MPKRRLLVNIRAEVGAQRLGSLKRFFVLPVCHAVWKGLGRITNGFAHPGYRKWWGTKTLTWFNPPGSTYAQAGFDVAINPEIGLAFNGKRHVLKLFLKTEPLTKTRADLIVTLMAHVLAPMEKTGTEFCVLDVRNGKAFNHSSTGKNFKPMVDAELSYIASLWPHV